MKKIKNFLFIWLPPIIWAGLIFIASSFPISLKVHPIIPFLDKIVHFFIYFPLSFLVSRALFFSHRKPLEKNFIVLTLVFCLLYGLSDEFHQLFVKTREFSLWDVLADFFGSLTGLIIFNLFRKKGKISYAGN